MAINCQIIDQLSCESSQLLNFNTEAIPHELPSLLNHQTLSATTKLRAGGQQKQDYKTRLAFGNILVSLSIWKER